MPIRRLPPTLVNKIAAGEVVERPASVVKELVENSLDAGASRVDVSVERGGMDLIRVADNGCGIPAEELELAVAPHATSKIATEEDLFAIRTLGFRGEALASIAAVSQLTLRSRTPQAEHGAMIEVHGGQAGPVVPCGCPVGTMVEVRNLFFNTPVRRKFLRSVQTELGHVSEALVRIALAQPEVHFTLRHQDRVLLELPAGEDRRERIARCCGRDLADALLNVESREGAVELTGYVSHPNYSRPNNRMQYFFLNGRFIRDRSLQHALAEAYRGLLMVGRFPAAFLFLRMPPEWVDVNVHPTKLEVRFQDGGRVYSLVLSALRARFLSTDMSARMQPTVADPSGLMDPHRAAEHRAAVVAWAKGKIAQWTSGGAVAADFGPAPWELDEAASGLGGSVGSGSRGGLPSQVSPSGVSDTPFVSPSAGLVGTHPAGFSGVPSGGLREVAPDQPSPQSPRASGSDVAAGITKGDQAGPQAIWSSGVAGGSAESRPAGEDRQAEQGRPCGASGGGVLGGGEAVGRPEPAMAPSGAPLPEMGLGNRQASRRPPAVQMHNRYLVAETEEGMLIFDQHALHESILYEELRERASRGPLETQRLLTPEPVDLSPSDAALLLEHRLVLQQVGLLVEPFGGSTVVVLGCPNLGRPIGAAELVHAVLEKLAEAGRTPSREELADALLHTLACRAAVKAGDPLRPEEIEALLARRHLAVQSHHCPHGRPTAILLTRQELDRQFKRT